MHVKFFHLELHYLYQFEVKKVVNKIYMRTTLFSDHGNQTNNETFAVAAYISLFSLSSPMQTLSNCSKPTLTMMRIYDIINDFLTDFKHFTYNTGRKRYCLCCYENKFLRKATLLALDALTSFHQSP